VIVVLIVALSLLMMIGILVLRRTIIVDVRVARMLVGRLVKLPSAVVKDSLTVTLGGASEPSEAV
jgi:biotin transporter BioY